MGKNQSSQCLSNFELKMLVNFFQAARTPETIADVALKKKGLGLVRKEARVKINHHNVYQILN